MHELYGIANGREVGQRVDDSIEWGMSAESQEQTNQSDKCPKADELFFGEVEGAVFAAKGLRDGPCADQHHEHPSIFTGAGMPCETAMMNFPTRLLADAAPIFATVRSIESIAEHACDQNAEGFHLWQAPLGCRIQLLLLGLQCLLRAGN